MYQLEAERIASSRHTMPRCLIMGGPQMGKSTLLKRVSREISTARLFGGRIYKGEDIERCHRALLGWSMDPRRDLLVDDLHLVLDDEIYNKIPRGRGSGRLVATWGGVESELKRKCDDYSDAPLQLFYRQRLMPWGGPWRARLQVEIADCLGQLAETVSALAREQAAQAALELVLEVSQGHPRMVGEAYTRVVVALDAGLTLPPKGLEDEQELTALKEELRQLERETFCRAATWFMSRGTLDKSPDFQALLTDIRRGRLRWHSTLMMSGLALEGDNGVVSYLSPVAEKVLQDRASPGAPPAQPGAQPRGLALVGQLADSGNPGKTCQLQGERWRLLQLLGRTPGQLMTVKALAAALNAPSLSAVRSTITNLKKQLTRRGLDHLLINVRRKGYTLDPRAMLTAGAVKQNRATPPQPGPAGSA